MQSVLLADHHPIIRSGIKSVITDILPGAVFDEVNTREEILQATAHPHHDLTVLDISLPGFNFPSDLAMLTRPVTDSPLLVFSSHSEEVFGLRCLKMGASGFVHKTAPEMEIRHAITKVLAGRKYFSAQLSDQVANLAVQDLPASPFDALSGRELEIASLITKGLSLPEIARQLRLGYSTCNTYKRRIFEKLNIQNTFSLSRLLQTWG